MSSKYVTPHPQAPVRLERPLGLEDQRLEGSLVSDAHGGNASRRFVRALRSYAFGLLAVFLITEIFRHLPMANVTTIGFAYLLSILVAAAASGIRTSLLMSVAAALVYDYFFIPPIGEWNIADPQNWIALTAFVITSVVGSTLSAWARRQTRQARLQHQEAEQLYNLSQRLLSAGESVALCNALPTDIMEAFGARAAALYLTEGQTLFYSPGGSHEFDVGLLKSCSAQRDIQANAESEITFVPLRLGISTIGSIGVAGSTLSRATLESLGSLITIAIERARALEQVGKIEAVRESERLKSSLLDAITHEFRTPLTAMKISVTGMLSDLHFDRHQCRELLSMIDEGCDRIDQLVGEVSEMSRLESGETKLDFARHTVANLIDASLADCKAALGARLIDNGIANQDVPIRVDLPWAAKAMVHLIANANLYSSPGKPITIRTETKNGLVMFSIADQGPGIDRTEIERIFEKFYRGKDHRFRVQGTGMGLPIAKAIIEAHGGTIGASSKPREGSVFYFTLPIDRSLEAGE
jgi:two-component system sensor histidine kinase KdpD